MMELELKYPYLSDEHEREEAAQYFISQFGQNTAKQLKLTVGPLKVASIEDQIDKYVRFKLNVRDSMIQEKGIFCKKKFMIFILKPHNINYETMLNIANVFYDLILAFDTDVNVSEAN